MFLFPVPVLKKQSDRLNGRFEYDCFGQFSLSCKIPKFVHRKIGPQFRTAKIQSHIFIGQKGYGCNEIVTGGQRWIVLVGINQRPVLQVHVGISD